MFCSVICSTAVLFKIRVNVGINYMFLIVLTYNILYKVVIFGE